MNKRLAMALLAAAGLLMLPAAANALIWDITPGDGGTITDGDGAWADGGGNWNTGSGDTIWSNASPDVAEFGSTGPGVVTVDSAGVSATALSFKQSYTVGGGPITLSGTTPTITYAAGTTPTVNSNITSTGSVTITGPGAAGPFLTLAGQNTFAGTVALSYTGVVDGVKVVLTGQNDFNGGLTVPGGADVTLNCATGYALKGNVTFAGTAGTSSYMPCLQDNQFGPGSTLTFTSTKFRSYVDLNGTDQTVAGLSCSTAASSRSAWIGNDLANTLSTVTIDNADAFSFVGAFRELEGGGKLAVVKGIGTQSLLGSRDAAYTNFSCGLTVEEGTLYAKINARTNFESSILVEEDGILDVHDWSGFNVPDGRSLGGNGHVIGDVLAATGSSIKPGESIGTLTITGNATLSGSFDVEYDDNAETIDTLIVTGAIDIDGATLNLSDLNGGAEELGLPYYVFVQYGSLGGTVGEFAAVNGQPDGYAINYAFEGDKIALVVPEPAVLVLLVGLFLALAGRRVRH